MVHPTVWFILRKKGFQLVLPSVQNRSTAPPGLKCLALFLSKLSFFVTIRSAVPFPNTVRIVSKERPADKCPHESRTASPYYGGGGCVFAHSRNRPPD